MREPDSQNTFFCSIFFMFSIEAKATAPSSSASLAGVPMKAMILPSTAFGSLRMSS